ncbi:hypothetical protein RS130_23135 [Paraglaciecola aquimarina]|uniref:Uncharacterized protein n=1 Tax=Paraglaciecola aquimarina TaxID=1235557 RepID=A0ABU3T2B0_9ALTE|nr:hypothetical protein [Paraglaciecola aquimarina]MDU0356401.1 hypothetical protein [Paraglaciecola aquimarina]
MLNFWLQPPAQPSYIKFSTVLEDLLDAVAAIEIVDNTLNADNASSIGNNLVQGELAPDWLQSNVFEQVTDAVDFSWLCQSPKFLTLAQYQPMKSLLNQTKMCQQLPLSFMRLAIFGAWQSVLVQAKRKSSQILANKLSQPPARQHQDYINELATCETQCKQVQAVIAYILYALRSPLFAGILLSQGPKILQQPLKKWLRQQVANTASPETDFFQPLQQWLLQHADGRAWLTQAELAFKNTNKMGFKTLPSLADVQIYQDGSEALTQCQQIIERYLVAIERAMGEKTSLTEIYRSDLCIFSNRFTQLYGAASD